MKIQTVLLPIVTATFESTVNFYKRITGEEVGLSAAHDGYKLNLIGNFVVLAAVDDPDSLRIPRMVDAIFLVDDINAYWHIMEKECEKLIIPLTTVSTGIRFIVKQNDGKTIEYLQLHKE